MIVSIALVVTAETAISIGAGGSAGTLADKVIVRDGWGRPIIPGSQVKGRARHAAESIVAALGLPTSAHFDDNTATPIRAIFGSPKHPSRLRFADLIAFTENREPRTKNQEPSTGEPENQRTGEPRTGEPESREPRTGEPRTGELGVLASIKQIETPDPLFWRDIGAIRPSVSINRRRGNAEDARLFFQETAPEGLQFGTELRPAISGELDDIAQLALLWAALRLWPRWGGAKSRGLGWSNVALQVMADSQVLDETELGAAFRLLEQSKVY